MPCWQRLSLPGGLRRIRPRGAALQTGLIPLPPLLRVPGAGLELSELPRKL